MTVRIVTDGYPHAYRVGGELVCERCKEEAKPGADPRLPIVPADGDVDDILLDRDAYDSVQCAWCDAVLGRVVLATE